MRMLLLLMLVQLAALSSSCTDVDRTEPNPVINLMVSKETHTGLQPVGILRFKGTNQGILELLNTNALGNELQLAWREINNQKELRLRVDIITEYQGEKIRAYGSRIVTPDDKDFPWAVYDTLEMEYGYSVEREN